MNESEILFAGKEIEINGEVIKVKPYTWTQAAKTAKPLAVLMKALIENIDGLTKLIESSAKLPVMGQATAFIEFISNLPEQDAIIEALTDMMVMATGKPKDFIESLMVDDAILVGRTVYDVNKDFFTKRLAKMKLPGQKKKLQK